MNRFLREPEVIQLLGVSTSTIRRLEKSKGFPKRQCISARCVGWPEEAIQAWIENKMKERRE